MARKKDENREKAKQLFLDSEGIMSNPEIAEALGVDSAKVRKWKCIDISAKHNRDTAKSIRPHFYR